jgi:hypothetical protein
MKPPAKRLNGDDWSCNGDLVGRSVTSLADNQSKCSLHVHAVTTPHNYGRVFSSTAPGYVMAVGSVGETLAPYGKREARHPLTPSADKLEDCDTFLSSDAGLTWTMVQEGAHKYEFGDQGSILVIADDEDVTDHVHYSYDGGKTWCVQTA